MIRTDPAHRRISSPVGTFDPQSPVEVYACLGLRNLFGGLTTYNSDGLLCLLGGQPWEQEPIDLRAAAFGIDGISETEIRIERPSDGWALTLDWWFRNYHENYLNQPWKPFAGQMKIKRATWEKDS